MEPFEQLKEVMLHGDSAAMKFANSPLADNELENYAMKIVETFDRSRFDMNPDGYIHKAVRPIGESVNNFQKLLLIAYRALFLGQTKGVKKGTLERCWDGICGWQA
jgi:hypothetical protein